MADNSIRRIAIAAPITAIAFDSKHHILYAGSGGQLLCYRNIGEQNDGKEMAEVGPNDIFSAHTIHGIKCVDSVIPKVISFGGKGVCVASIQEDQTQLHARSIDEFMVELLLEDLDDLVLDCFLTDTMLFIGFAHNFIDVMVIIRAQLAPTFIYRVQCPDISALFSLTIAVSDPDFNSEDHRRMLVASGTAFGKIILWDFSLPIIATAESALSQENVIPTITINNTLINHEGVIFRLQWSRDKSKIASVSDDRTVRVWNVSESNKGYQIFVGWGHISRLWDVIFLGELEDMVATSSEDGTIKIWDLRKNVCAVTLRGHSSDVWCLAVAAFSCNARNLLRGAIEVVGNLPYEENLFLFSGGNDGSVKSWSVNAHSIACPEDPTASTRTLLMPQIPSHPSHTVMKCGNNQLDSIQCISQCGSVESPRVAASRSRRSNGVCAVKLDPSGQLGIVCLCEGGIWLVNFACASSASKVAPASTLWPEEVSVEKEGKSQPSGLHGFDGDHELHRSWIFLINLDKGVTNADVDFNNCKIDSEGDECSYLLKIFCAHPDGFITVLKVSPQASCPAKEGFSLRNHRDLIVERKAWKVHNLRAINVWHLGAEVHKKGVEETVMNYGDEQLLLTSSVRGVCRLWRGSKSTSEDYNLIFECVTAKEQIATCCTLMGDKCLIIGDSRGGISIFRWGSESSQVEEVVSSGGLTIYSLPSNDECQHNPAQEGILADDPKRLPVDMYIPHAHGSELVSNIRENCDGGGFYSVGHDGFFCIFSSAGRLISKLKCLPIKSPDKIFVVGRGKEESFYIGGFLGDLYLVYDIRRRYQVMRIEGGGWKRPHHSVLFVPGPIEAKQKGRRSNSWNELPRVVFVCTAPTKDDTSLMFCDSMPIVTVFLKSEVKPHCTSSLGQRTQKVPLHLCTQSHGKVSYCARIVPQIGFHDAQDDIISSSGHRVKERNTFCVVGGEDGSIKIFKCSKILGTTSSSGDTKIQEKVREDCIKNSSFVFLEEVNMPGNVAVKAIAIASRHDSQNSGVEVAESKGIIVAVGGRLTFSIWEYSLQDFVGKSGGDFGSHLSILTSGSVDPKSSQDHRILSVQCTLFPKMKDIFYDSIFSPTIPLNSDFIETESNKLHDFYLVVMGDSRGSVTVATYDNGVQVNGNSDYDGARMPERSNRLCFIDEFNAADSGCPVLTCDVLILRSKIEVKKKYTDKDTEKENRVVLLLGLFGDTAGTVSVWLLSGSVLRDRTQISGWSLLKKSRPLFRYLAHAMGTNTLSAVETPPKQVSKCDDNDNETAPHSGSDTLSWGLFIASGGDDQAITGCSAMITITQSENGSSLFTSNFSHSRANGCSGSAIKGLKVLFLPTSCDKEMHERCESVKNFRDIAIASVGYDQRLAIWRPTSTLLSPDQNLCTQVTVNNFNFSQVLEHGKNSSDEKYDNDEDREEVTFSKFEEIVLARDALLMWIAGATIHVGDVCALDAILTCSDNSAMKSYNSENIPNSISREKCVSDISADKVDHVGARDGNISDVDIIVVGEGFQLLSFHV